MRKIFRKIKQFRMNVFRKLINRITKWASNAELELIDKMREESNRIMTELSKIEQERNDGINSLAKHFSELHSDSEKEFMRNNKEISDRYRKLNASAERQLELATDLVVRLNNIFDKAHITISKFRGLMHSRVLTIESIQRSTALLNSDIKTLEEIDHELSEVKVSKEKIIRNDIQKLTDNRPRLVS